MLFIVLVVDLIVKIDFNDFHIIEMQIEHIILQENEL